MRIHLGIVQCDDKEDDDICVNYCNRKKKTKKLERVDTVSAVSEPNTRYTYVVQIDVQVDTMETCKRWSILNQSKILHRRYRTLEIKLEIDRLF